MKLLHRIGYYLGGFSLGLIILAFFLNGKKTSCSYGPNARTVKNISQKPKSFSTEAQEVMRIHKIDTTTITQIIQLGEVNFSESDTKAEPCKFYVIENTYKEKPIEINVENCEKKATITTIKYN
ncbi:MAG: hypothetical protein BM564_12095 [Bacteroidetes bacterium MedPE-SWsnd-G2]|nr:MAG: hypothetical protein BM564_12095 [Bacteroidetes bacterium MedPE-SWsnd-G2]